MEAGLGVSRQKLGSLAANEVQSSVKFDNSLSRLWGEGGQRPGEGAGANGAMSLGGLRLLANPSLASDHSDEKLEVLARSLVLNV